MMECDKCLEMFDEHKTLGIVLKGEDYVISVCEKCLATEVVRHWLKSDQVKGV